MDRIHFIKGFPDHGHVVPVGNFATYFLSLKAKAIAVITAMECMMASGCWGSKS